jgi:hypothetical protein
MAGYPVGPAWASWVISENRKLEIERTAGKPANGLTDSQA